MKFKILVKLIEKLLGVAGDGEGPRADVFLPDKLLAMSLGFMLLGIGCGLLMTTAVTFARQKHYLPLLFAVPLFIICGFTHCVADAFYYLCVPVDFMKAHALEILGVYGCIVLGNLIGCNLYRIVLPKELQ